MSQDRVLGVIVARGGSKRLPRKNLALLGGKPLIAHSIEAARASRGLYRTVVSTDDEEIAGFARSMGADVPFLRPAELARDDSPVAGALLHALEQAGADADAVALLQATSPLRTSGDIDQAIDLFRSTGADTVTAVSSAGDHPYWCWAEQDDGSLAPYFSREYMAIERAALPVALVENGAVYVVRRPVLHAGSIYGAKVVPYRIDAAHAIDIDYAEDLARADQWLRSRGAA